jgi:uncharacterized membrane protein YhaH (DUF805 family)
MLSMLSFQRQLRPGPYALSSLGVFFSQHAIACLVLAAHGRPLASFVLDRLFLFMPLQMLARQGGLPNVVLIGSFLIVLLAACALAALAFQRAHDAGITGWVAAGVLAPVVQLAVIVILGVVPARATASALPDAGNPGASGMTTAVQGLAAGVALTLSAVALGALFFGAYGFGIFVVSPFIIGATTGYFANRTVDLGRSGTSKLVLGALVLGGLALVLVALEGVVCLILASPLAIGIAVVGGFLGRAIAVHARHPPRHALSGLALLPLVFAAETMLPAAVTFESHSTIRIAAPPEAVWPVLLRTDLSHEPVGLPFRLGVAYPLHGETLGEGIGAMRRGTFSTGTVREEVTQWVPNRKLAFVMLDELPAMRELSPYAHVHAPHVTGYFRILETVLELAPLADGGTELIERTSHELRLEPVLYWLPLARWMVHENNARVLAHIRRRAEASVRRND